MADRTFLEWPFLDVAHRALAKDLTAWRDRDLDERHDPDPSKACRAYATQLGAAGWLKYAVPRAYGGATEAFDVPVDLSDPRDPWVHVRTWPSLRSRCRGWVPDRSRSSDPSAQGEVSASGRLRRVIAAFRDLRGWRGLRSVRDENNRPLRRFGHRH
jgi:hypothetical protein